MRFDAHTALGHWPFRQIPHQTAPALRALLEVHGITRAAVVNTHGLFYKNCQDANLELAEWIQPHRDFFVPVGTLNLAYPAWERDLLRCREELGFAGLRMAPQYHDYRLQEDAALALGRLCRALGLPVLIPHRVVDIRQRHWFDTERTLSLEEVGSWCEAVPGVRVLVTEAPGPGPALLRPDGSPRYPGLLLETSRVGSAGLADAAAAQLLLFGSGAPFKHVTPARLKLETSGLGELARKRVEWENARELFGAGT